MPVTINGTTGVIGPDGSASTPSYQGADSNTGMFFPAADTISFTTAGTEDVRIDSVGEVTRFNTSPGGVTIKRTDGVNSNGWLNFVGSDDVVDGSVRMATDVANALTFQTAATERARIDSSGNLLVGSTTTGYADSRLVLSLDNSTKWVTGPGAGIATRFYVSASNAGGVYLNGTSATSWTAISDERYKTDLTPIAGGLAKVCSLRAVTGRLTTDEIGTSKAFLIAQDVLAVLPEAVDTTDPDRYGLAYTDTIPLMVAAIKELSAKLDAATALIAALQADVAALKGQA